MSEQSNINEEIKALTELRNELRTKLEKATERISDRGMAKVIGMDHVTLGRFLTGKGKAFPDPKNAAQLTLYIADNFSVSVDEAYDMTMKSYFSYDKYPSNAELESFRGVCIYIIDEKRKNEIVSQGDDIGTPDNIKQNEALVSQDDTVSGTGEQVKQSDDTSILSSTENCNANAGKETAAPSKEGVVSQDKETIASNDNTKPDETFVPRDNEISDKGEMGTDVFAVEESSARRDHNGQESSVEKETSALDGDMEESEEDLSNNNLIKVNPVRDEGIKITVKHPCETGISSKGKESVSKKDIFVIDNINHGNRGEIEAETDSEENARKAVKKIIRKLAKKLSYTTENGSAFVNGAYGFAVLTEDINLPSSISAHFIFGVMFTEKNYDQRVRDLKGVNEHKISKRLGYTMKKSKGYFVLCCENTAVFNRALTDTNLNHELIILLYDVSRPELKPVLKTTDANVRDDFVSWYNKKIMVPRN